MFCRFSKLCFQESHLRFMTSTSKQAFRPRRRPNRDYRPLKPRGIRKVKKRNILSDLTAGRGFNHVDDFQFDRDDLDEYDYDPDLLEAIRERRRDNRNGGGITIEEKLRIADYLTAAPGSLEEMQGERRILALEGMDDEARKSFHNNMNRLVEDLTLDSLQLGENEYPDEEEVDDSKGSDKLPEEVDRRGQPVDPLRLAFGQW